MEMEVISAQISEIQNVGIFRLGPNPDWPMWDGSLSNDTTLRTPPNTRHVIGFDI